MLLYVGRYTEVKRIPLLIRAYARARDEFATRAPLVILGGYPGEWEGEHPLEVIRDTGVDDVFLPGWRSHDDLADGLNASDVVVLPSVREQFGQVLVEGMACGLPAIAVDAHGPATIITDGEDGWLVPADDEEAMADALVEAVGDPDERRRRGDAAYESSRARYSWPALAQEVAARLRRRRRGPAGVGDGARAAARHRLTAALTSAGPMDSLEYRIRRSDRARHARIVVDADGVEVVVPRRMALRHVEPFVREKQPWIERTLRRYQDAALDGPMRRRPARRRRGPLPGRAARPGRAGRAGPHPAARPPPRRRLDRQGGPAGPRADPRRARALVPARGPRPRSNGGSTRPWPGRARSYSRLTIRQQRTRWASCSSNGSMSFNWRLLLAPAEILDYVVEHEVAHLDVLDHSPRFWRLVRSRVPDYKQHERWLRRNGPALRL